MSAKHLLKFVPGKKYPVAGARVDLARVDLAQYEGHPRPYFSVTGFTADKGRLVSGGACHAELKSAFPELEFLISMHLADDDGVPLYAIENGWYWFELGNLEVLARQFRVTPEFVATLKPSTTKKEFSRFVDALRPTWKAEAARAVEEIENLPDVGEETYWEWVRRMDK